MTKTADDFYHIRSSSDGLASNCKECAVKIANTTRKHFHEHPTVTEKVIALSSIDAQLCEPIIKLISSLLASNCKQRVVTIVNTSRKHLHEHPTKPLNVCVFV